MFGALRLFLAAVVVAYHAGYSPLGLRIGVSAVVVFFMISGYVITGLYAKRFVRVQNAPHFYFERLVRIAPQYYFYLIVGLAFLYGFGFWSEKFPRQELDVMSALSNFTLIPMGLAVYFPWIIHFAVLGHAVSLANEAIFYLLVPFIFLLPKVKAAAVAVSMAVFCLATHGAISMVAYSYNYLPGPLIFFFLGHFIYTRQWRVLGLLVFVLAANHAHLIFTGHGADGFTTDVYIGVYTGLAAVLLLRNRPFNKVDDMMGALSYGCFLAHYVLLLPLRHYHVLADKPPAFLALLLSLSLGLAFLSYWFVERPTLALRRKSRLSAPLLAAGAGTNR